MNRTVKKTLRYPKRSIIKASILALFIGGSIGIFFFTPFKRCLSAETLNTFLISAGLWAPLLFLIIYAGAVCLFIPASILTLLGAAVFGAHWGFIYGWIGAMVGASGAFLIGRALGRDFVASLLKNKLKEYDNVIRKNGFTTVLYLRLINLPFTFLSFGMSLTNIRFSDFFFGTAFGVVIGIFILTSFGGMLKHIIFYGDFSELISFKEFFVLCFFILSLLLPSLIKKIKMARHTHTV